MAGYCNTRESFFQECGHYIFNSEHVRKCHPNKNGQCENIIQRALHYSEMKCIWCRYNKTYVASEIFSGNAVLLNPNKRNDKNWLKSCADSFKKRTKDEAIRCVQAMHAEHKRQDTMRLLFEKEDEELTKQAAAQYIPIREHPLEIRKTTNSHLLRAVSADDSRVCWVVQLGEVQKSDSVVPLCSLCRGNFICGQDVRRLPCCMVESEKQVGWQCVFHMDCILEHFAGRGKSNAKWYECPGCEYPFKILAK